MVLAKSCWSAVFSGMPQVSVLEPSLILYVDDHIYLICLQIITKLKL